MMEGNTNAALGRLDLPKGMTAYNSAFCKKEHLSTGNLNAF